MWLFWAKLFRKLGIIKTKNETYVATQTPYFCLSLSEDIVVSTGKKRTLPEIQIYTFCKLAI